MHWVPPRKTSASYVTTNLPGMYREHDRALLTEARLNYSPGIWVNISGGRYTEKNGPTAFENILSHIAELYSEDRENQPNL